MSYNTYSHISNDNVFLRPPDPQPLNPARNVSLLLLRRQRSTGYVPHMINTFTGVNIEKLGRITFPAYA